MPPLEAWQELLATASMAFTRPGFQLFRVFVTGWVLCAGRRTVTGMFPAIDPQRRRSVAAYHHFLRDGAWSSRELWRGLVLAVLARHCPAGVPVDLAIDDSLVHRAGPLVEGADVFRDPVRSTKRRTVYARGINTVALCVLVRLPLLRQPLALTVDKRDFRKGGPSHVALAAEMVRALAALCPDRRFRLVADGAYASLAGEDLPRSVVVSRLRRDAALYECAPARRPGQRGRPRKKGARLPTPPGLAAAASRSRWQKVDLRQRGRTVTRLLLSRTVLWYGASGTRPLLLVIVRDPAGREPDDFFFSTDLDAAPADVASLYYDRWAIEVTFRDVKQLLTPQHIQSWRRCGPGRAVALGFWLHSAVWLHYLQTCADRPSWPDRPWYPDKRSPSFADARSALRTALWQERLSPYSQPDSDAAKLADALVAVLARAG